jgi:putative ABC transport system substrate-binding protein
LGYIEGKNVEIDERFLVDLYPLLPEAAAKLAAANVDVMVCFGSTAIIAASKATTTIPIVMLAGTDPVKAGFADSFARPGKNITGIAMVNLELGAKRLELLKQAVPGLRLAGVPLNPESAREPIAFQDLERIARSLNLELRSIPVRNLGELDAAMSAAGKLGVTAFSPLPSTMFIANPRAVVSAIEKTGLPAIYHSDEFTRVGGLMSYGPRQAETFRHAAVFVDKILKGAKAGDLPIEQPTKFAFIINQQAAKKLGLAVPRELLLRADEVIE